MSHVGGGDGGGGLKLEGVACASPDVVVREQK